jgi:hypothetical protein
MRKTRTKVERVEGVTARVDIPDPEAERHYQETISLLCAWDGETDLAAELRRRNRNKPRLEPLDMSNTFDEGVQFVQMVNRVAERLRAGVEAQTWERAGDEKSEPRQESMTARRLLDRFRG